MTQLVSLEFLRQKLFLYEGGVDFFFSARPNEGGLGLW